MQKMTVEYYITGDERERLEYITDLFNRATGKDHTPEQTFTALMTIGSARDIRDKMDYAESNFLQIIHKIA